MNSRQTPVETWYLERFGNLSIAVIIFPEGVATVGWVEVASYGLRGQGPRFLGI